MKKENIIKEQMPATDFDDMWEKLYFILTGFDHIIQSYDFFCISIICNKIRCYIIININIKLIDIKVNIKKVI